MRLITVVLENRHFLAAKDGRRNLLMLNPNDD